MAGNEITDYAAELRGWLAKAGADVSALNDLTAKATALNALAAGPVSPPAWQAALDDWNNTRDKFGDLLIRALLGPLADIPGLTDLASDVGRVGREGIHGGFDLGPVHLEVSSALLVIQPPIANSAAVAIGPFQISAIAATMSSPFGGKGLPGGGSLVRMPDGGFGGTLELPLGAVQISASAVIALIDGQPSLLAIMGVAFIPPIQLSFGFSLDRVGGIVGVNRRVNTEALRAATRTGTAGDVLFAVRPPDNPLALVVSADQLFPRNRGTHLVGPSLKVSWLSFGPPGSLIGLDLGVIVEIPTGKVAILGVGRIAIPGLPMLLNLRIDLLGLIDPVEQLVSIDASLVDSHVLGIFDVYGDAAARFSWGATGYVVVTVGGFYPGFNPEPAHLPALRRIGMAMAPMPVIDVRAEGYFAVTSNSIQLGGRWQVGISLGLEAHGFLQVDALVQFRPFYFKAGIAAGFDVSVAGFSFCGISLKGSISGPGPLVIQGSLSIDVFLFSLSWDETFTIGSGPSDSLSTPESLLKVITDELNKADNVQSGSIGDPLVVLSPRPGDGAGFAAIPPTGTLRVAQRRAPLGLLIDRVDGRPLGGPQGVKITNGNEEITERFSPGTYITLTNAEALNRPPFDLLASGRIFSPADPALDAARIDDARDVDEIVIKDGGEVHTKSGTFMDLSAMSALVSAAGKPPALSNAKALVTATQEVWTATGTAATFTSATAAHQFVRYQSGVAQPAADAKAPLNLAGV